MPREEGCSRVNWKEETLRPLLCADVFSSRCSLAARAARAYRLIARVAQVTGARSAATV